MLIFDGHQSHILNEAIEFCEAHKIILLCLPSHSTHLLQPLHVSFLRPLANAYRKQLLEVTKFATHVSVNKAEFIEWYYQARKAIGMEVSSPKLLTVSDMTDQFRHYHGEVQEAIRSQACEALAIACKSPALAGAAT